MTKPVLEYKTMTTADTAPHTTMLEYGTVLPLGSDLCCMQSRVAIALLPKNVSRALERSDRELTSIWCP